MSKPGLPMTVIGGYLGSGKTTLINQLLAEPHGKRLVVMVNDFGAINIDASLLLSAEGDTLTLTNGCVCCTMGSDLYMAIADVLDRSPQPDHLLVEASGIADPGKIANAARAEPELRYGGVVTVVDACHFLPLMNDALVGPQVCSQISCADRLVVSKTRQMSRELFEALAGLSQVEPVLSCNCAALCGLLLNDEFAAVEHPATATHPDYLRWSHVGQEQLTEQQLRTLCQQRPVALYRLKGFARGVGGSGWHIQAVGCDVDIRPMDNPPETTLVGIGLSAQISLQHCEIWWQSNTAEL